MSAAIDAALVLVNKAAHAQDIPVLAGGGIADGCGLAAAPHTGMNEAIPAVKYVGQFFEHVGFDIVDEWHMLSEFFNSSENNTQGRMGDIRGLPGRARPMPDRNCCL